MRLIDADALNKKLCETTIFIKDGEVFQRMINDAPTVADAAQIPIKLEKRYPKSRDEDITDAFMRGYLAGRSSAPDSRQRGEWHEDSKGYFYCDQCCKYPKYQEAKTDFCPSCGADMRKGDNNGLVCVYDD